MNQKRSVQSDLSMKDVSKKHSNFTVLARKRRVPGNRYIIMVLALSNLEKILKTFFWSQFLVLCFGISRRGVSGHNGRRVTDAKKFFDPGPLSDPHLTTCIVSPPFPFRYEKRGPSNWHRAIKIREAVFQTFAQKYAAGFSIHDSDIRRWALDYNRKATSPLEGFKVV